MCLLSTRFLNRGIFCKLSQYYRKNGKMRIVGTFAGSSSNTGLSRYLDPVVLSAPQKINGLKAESEGSGVPVKKWTQGIPEKAAGNTET